MPESPLFPADILQDNGALVHHNLNGSFSDSRYIKNKRDVRELQGEVVIAHEHRHYIDYHLTNYGSWLSRFWDQFKQGVPDLLVRGGRIPVPVTYFDDDTIVRALGLDRPDLTTPAGMAVRIASNHALRVERDYLISESWARAFNGPSQMEALATVFEVGPAEHFARGPLVANALMTMPRDQATWQRQYTWFGDVLAALGIRDVIKIGEDHQAVSTRIWGPFLLAAMMGKFSRLFAKELNAEPKLFGEIMPAGRLHAILNYAHQKRVRDLDDPDLAWDIVNDACLDLYGESVLESLSADIEFWEKRLMHGLQDIESLNPFMLGLIAHLETRKSVAARFAENPSSLYDPIEYWDKSQVGAHVLPEFMLASSAGFESIPDGYIQTSSMFYSSPDGDRANFIKPRVASAQHRELQAADEEATAISRFLISGARSRTWVGPERDRVRAWLQSRVDIRVIGPFG
ncbi:hypothetical protein GCM10009867_21040 [Pedococcus aerophilus]|uniref:Uncharacterized protein n=1 Tax=Pedococcus aerophilus TaxID=436356 RepID=A0ABN3UNX4_9MICO